MYKKIKISPTTKPLALHAIDKRLGDEWLILVSHIKECNSVLKIYRHLSIDLVEKIVFFDGNAQKCWGSTANFDFYIAEQIEKNKWNLKKLKHY